MYTYSNRRGFDLIVPVRYRRPEAEPSQENEEQYDYCPLLVSVKNCLNISPGEQEELTEAMVAVLENEGIKTGLCMLFLEGLQNPQNFSKIVDEDIFRFSGAGIYSFTVALDSDDPFGISDFLENASTCGGERSEVYVSHSDAFFTPDMVASEDLLRKNATESASGYLERMREEFELGKKGNKLS